MRASKHGLAAMRGSLHSSARGRGPCRTMSASDLRSGRTQLAAAEQRSTAQPAATEVLGRSGSSSPHSPAATPAQSVQQGRALAPPKGRALYGPLEGGWGVGTAEERSPPAATSGDSTAAAAPGKQPAAAPARAREARITAAGASARPRKAGARARTPAVELRSEEGLMGLTLLQKALTAEGGAPPRPEDITAVKAALAERQRQRGRRGLPGMSGLVAARQGVRPGGAQRADVEEEFAEEDEDEDEELSTTPQFELVLGESGTEVVEYDARGQRKAAATPLAPAQEGRAAGEEEFGDFGWEQFDELVPEDEEDEEHDAVSPAELPQPGSLYEEAQTAALRDLGQEDDWGLDELEPGSASSTASESLYRQMVRQEMADEASEYDRSVGGSVQWGGSGGARGTDMEEQEALLRRYFTDSKVRQLMASQREVDANYAEMQRKASSASSVEHRLHRQLRIVGGRVAGRRLLSSRGAQTRPMMEKVRQAIFNMVLAQAGANSVLPPGSRWLDLFAGTASVGLEALSRGAHEAHFVEMDPWVVTNITAKNIATCGYTRAATVHTTRAEDYLRRAAAVPDAASGGFDFISVCPPYLLVSYPELYELLGSSPLVKPSSIVFVEYPKQLAHQVLDRLGPLVRVRNRKYGRTFVAIYAPHDGSGTAGCERLMDDSTINGGSDMNGLALLGLQLPPP